MSSWFDPESGHEAQRPTWVHPPERRSLVPLVLTVAFVAIAGYITWQLVQTAPTLNTSNASAMPFQGGDEFAHQMTVEAGQQEQTGLLVIIAERLISPSPTVEPTKRPTSTPVPKVVLPSCEPSSALADGTTCKPFPTPTPKLTAIPSPTPELCSAVFARPVALYAEKPCLWINTPTPWSGSD